MVSTEQAAAVAFAASAVLSLSVQAYYQKICQLRVFCRDSVENTALLVQCKSLEQYRPTPFYLLDYYGHTHTIVFSLIRQLFNRRLRIDRELFKLADGGTVGLDWVISAMGEDYPPAKPLAVLVNIVFIIIIHVY